MRIKPVYLGICALLIPMWLASYSATWSQILGDRNEPHPLIVSYGIPLAPSLGLDFINQYSYVRCAGPTVEIYQKKCYDPQDRPYVYPPLLALFFTWTLWFEASQAAGLWSLFVAVVCFWCAAAWPRMLKKVNAGDAEESSAHEGMVLAALMTLSYPVLFSVERGNNDVLVLVLVTAAVSTLLARRWFWAGALLSMASLLKVYPVYLSLVFTAAAGALWVRTLLRPEDKELRSIPLAMMAGQAAVAVPVLIGLYPQYHYYLTRVLPEWMDSRAALFMAHIAHSMTADYGPAGPWIVWSSWILSTACFVYWFIRWIEAGRDPKARQAMQMAIFSFTTVAALMVYFAVVSFDYNLILLIPLIMVLCAGPLEGVSPLWQRSAVVFLVLGYGLPRWLTAFVGPYFFMHLQVAGFALIHTVQLRALWIDRGSGRRQVV